MNDIERFCAALPELRRQQAGYNIASGIMIAFGDIFTHFDMINMQERHDLIERCNVLLKRVSQTHGIETRYLDQPEVQPQFGKPQLVKG